jgi:hypothetical protein
MHAAEEVLVTRIVTNAIETRVLFQNDHPGIVVRVGHLQIFQGLLLLVQPNIDFG